MKELLAPAGSMDALVAAIKGGADAVYLAGKLFGARKYAANFTNEELREAVNYAHLYDVKIYVTVNTIIYERELQDCLSYIGYLYEIGVDALIMQDLGMIKLVRKYFPDFPIHASTQAHTHNLRQIQFLESLGVKRVVLAREMSIDEINKLDTSMELEVFIHGALCISYSGECLFSSFLRDRSGNRGECAGLCRLPYTLKKENQEILKDQYLLSPKELNTTSYMEALKESNIVSFKIEGRMKSPEYVYFVTHIYRKLLDQENYHLTEEEVFQLKSLYNRGFTKGFLFHESDRDWISLSSSNHQGVKIGEVVEVNKKKIKIKLTHDLYQEDGIRLPNQKGMIVNFLYDKNMLLVNHALKGSIIYVDNKVELKETGDVFLTTNKYLIEEIKKIPNPVLNVQCRVEALIGRPLVVSYQYKNIVIRRASEVVSKAKNAPLSDERLKAALTKLGNTPFVVSHIDGKMDPDIFIPMSLLNQLRRDLIQELTLKKIEVKREKISIPLLNYPHIRAKRKPKLSILVRNQEQLEVAIKNHVDIIYVTDYNLYQKYKCDSVFYRLERVQEQYREYQDCHLLIGETGSISYASCNEVVSDYYLNVVNSKMVELLHDYGVKRVTLSPELKFDDFHLLIDHLDDDIEVEALLYGRIEYMIMKYRMKDVLHLKDDVYYLEANHKKFPIVMDQYTHLFSEQAFRLEFISSKVDVYRIELFDEKGEEVEQLICMIKEKLD